MCVFITEDAVMLYSNTSAFPLNSGYMISITAISIKLQVFDKMKVDFKIQGTPEVP